MKRPPGKEALDRQCELRAFGTEAEKGLWSCLRNRQIDGCKFRRQVWIGNYVVDFICLERRLVIEADGSQHVDQMEYDDRRSAFLMREGFRVMRFWNNEVLSNLDGVAAMIGEALLMNRPSPSHPAVPGGPLLHRVNSAPRCSGHAGGMADPMHPCRERG